MSILGQIPVLSWRPDERDYVSISEREGERVRRGHYPGWVSWESGGADHAPERGAGGCRSALDLEERPQDSDQLPGVEGFGEKATPQRAVSLCGHILIQGGHDHPHGRVGWSFVGAAKPVQDGSTLAVGELEVEENGVWGLLLEDAKGFASHGYLAGVKPSVAEAEAQYSGHRLVVLDDKHLRSAISRHRRRRANLR